MGERGTSPAIVSHTRWGAAVHSLRFRRQAVVGIVGAMVRTLLAVPYRTACSAQKSDPTIQAVGSPTVFSSASTVRPKTAVPNGVAAGNVLVSYIETPVGVTIACAAGWTKQVDRATTKAHLVACTKIAGATRAQPSATVTPATNVSTATPAYSGVDTTHPVASAAAVTGLTGPTVTPARLPARCSVLGQGSDHWRVTFLAPHGATRVVRTNDGAGSQLTAANRAVRGPRPRRSAPGSGRTRTRPTPSSSTTLS